MKLLIPGPVSTHPDVRAAAGEDFAPWDRSFRPLYGAVRTQLAALAGVPLDTHAVLPLQGAGHFAVEAALRSLLPPGGRILIPVTGAYAQRMARLAQEAGRAPVAMPVSDIAPVPPEMVARALADDPSIGHVGLVYSETSSGIVHDAAAIGAVVRAAGRRMILDAVSAFGALPLDLSQQPEIEAAIFTANKCLEGLPGLSFVIAQIAPLLAARGQAGSWSFDLADIYAVAEREGWGGFRFTPPAQVMAALRTALALHAAEGGTAARRARYCANAEVLYGGMQAIGLTPYLDRAVQGPIVMNVHAPDDRHWSLAGFVEELRGHGFIISNFHNTARPSFRVGCIGAITPEDMRRFVGAADLSLIAMGVTRRAPAVGQQG